VNGRRVLPSNISINATNSLEAVLEVNGTLFCSNNATLSLNLSENNNPALNTTRSFTFYEIAMCLGWNNVHVFVSIALYVSLLFRYTLTTLIVFYKITDLDKFKGKLLISKLITIWLVEVFLYIWARKVDDMTESNFPIFWTLYCLANPIVLSRKVMRYLSVEYQISLGWWSAWLIVMITTTVIASIPKFGGNYVNKLQVFLPLILTGLDYFACKAVELCFNEHRHNLDGQAMLMSLYIWRMEVSRFDCFTALILGWNRGTVPFQDVLLNAFCSLVGEIWTHAGIREAGIDLFSRKVGCAYWLKSDFPEIVECFSSIRAVLEWAVPAIASSILCLLEWRREYISVPDNDIVIQIYFFTSVKLFRYVFQIILIYYLVELLSLVLCWLIKKEATGYEEMSVLGSLGWSSILSLVFGVVSLQDVGFTGKYWSAAVDLY